MRVDNNTKATLPPVDAWRLIDECIDSELRYGIHRYLKYHNTPLSDESIDLIIGYQHHAIMNWFAEYFKFNDLEDGSPDDE